jgi:hypothetical protein
MEMNKTFEEEIYATMEKFLENGKLKIYDINICRDICEQYENKIIALELSEKIKLYCKVKKHDINFDNKEEKIYISFYETNGNKLMNTNSNKKEQMLSIMMNLYNCSVKITYDICDEQSDDNKCKFVYHKFIIDGSLILKKENNSLKNNYVNFSCVRRIIDENKIKLTDIEFVNMILNLMNLTDIFEKLIIEVEFELSENKNKDKYYKNEIWESDSDISVSNSNLDSDSDREKS